MRAQVPRATFAWMRFSEVRLPQVPSPPPGPLR